MNKLKLKKGILIGCMISAALLLGFIGSYAYFIGTGNNNQNQSANIQTGNMALTFSDGNNGINESLNFGESVIKTFTIKNTGSLDATAKINWLNLTNTYLKESLTYTLLYSESEDGEYTELVTDKNVPRSETSATKTLVNNLTIPVGTKYYYKLEITLNYLEDIDQTVDLNAMLSTQFELEEGYEQGMIPIMVDAMINDEPLPENFVKEGNPIFVNSATTDETANGLYAMEDDYGTSYYFRGAVENNYVKFGGFYWRIIRINGDGSLRMIYDGTSAHANGTSSTDRVAITNVVWNTTNYNDAKYVGYMYGGTNGSASTSKEQAQTNETSSNMKIQLENWYKTNIGEKKLDGYVADSIFCNDRTTPGREVSGWSLDTGLGYSTYPMAFGANTRLVYGNVWTSKPNPLPSLKCIQKNDAFTKDDTNNGNGKLGEKVGLIMSDEVSIAGGVVGKNNLSYYLSKGLDYWLFSPTSMNRGAYVFNLNASGNLDPHYANVEGSVAPVISLIPEYVTKMKGNGTIGNEYHLGPDSFSRSQ